MEAHLLCLVSDLCNSSRQAMQLTKCGISQRAANGRQMDSKWAENERQMRGKRASNRWLKYF